MAVHDTERPSKRWKDSACATRSIVAILDMHIPGMDGATLAARIREAGPSLPLVLFAQPGSSEEVSEGLFAARLAKPLRQSQPSHAGNAAGVRGRAQTRCRASSAPHRYPDGLRPPLRILLAEDNAVNQKLALRLLRQMGYRADVASNGLEVDRVRRCASRTTSC